MYFLQIELNLWHNKLKRHSFWDGESNWHTSRSFARCTSYVLPSSPARLARRPAVCVHRSIGCASYTLLGRRRRCRNLQFVVLPRPFQLGCTFLNPGWVRAMHDRVRACPLSAVTLLIAALLLLACWVSVTRASF